MMPGAAGQMVAPVDPNACWLADLQYPCSVLFVYNAISRRQMQVCLLLSSQGPSDCKDEAICHVAAFVFACTLWAKLWEFLAALFILSI